MKKLWDKAELMAIEYLKRNNYNILDTNFKFWRFGEIDIIASSSDITTFIEVKYRSNDTFWSAEESISKQKKYKILKSIEYYCLKNNINLEHIRFDVIVILKKIDSFRLIHYKNQELY